MSSLMRTLCHAAQTCQPGAVLAGGLGCFPKVAFERAFRKCRQNGFHPWEYLLVLSASVHSLCLYS